MAAALLAVGLGVAGCTSSQGPGPVVAIRIPWGELDQLIQASQADGEAPAGLKATHVGAIVEAYYRGTRYAGSVARFRDEDVIHIQATPGRARLFVVAVYQDERAAAYEYGKHFVLGLGALNSIHLSSGAVAEFTLGQLVKEGRWAAANLRVVEPYRKYYEADPPVFLRNELPADSTVRTHDGQYLFEYQIELPYPYHVRLNGEVPDYDNLLIRVEGYSGRIRMPSSGRLSVQIGCALVRTISPRTETPCWRITRASAPAAVPVSYLVLRHKEFGLPEATYIVPPLVRNGLSVRW